MKKIIYFTIGLLLIGQLHFAKAQSNCANTLYEANKSYEAGDFKQSVSLLRPCLNSGFSRDEKFEGYRLLALNYIYLNEPAKADSAVQKMLSKNHSYKLFPNISDPAGLTKLVDAYDVIPVFTCGIDFFGVNFTNINLINNKSVSNTTASYQPLLGFQFGVNFDYAIWKRFHLAAGVQYYGNRYQHNLDSVAGWAQQFTEDLTYFNIPVAVRYYPYFRHDGTIRAYVEAGASYSYLFNDNATIFSTDNSNGNTNRASVNPITRRNTTNTSILVGAGLQYSVGNAWLTLNARYLNGLTNIVNSENRYNDQDFIFNYQYVDDDFKFNNWQFSLGVAFPLFYNVERIKGH
jgi:hypothetical protein